MCETWEEYLHMGQIPQDGKKWPFRVTFFLKVEPSCGQTVKDKPNFSIDPGQVGL